MKRRVRIGAAVLGAAIVVLGLGAVVVIADGRSRPVAASAPQTLAVSCRSPALSRNLPALVYLPSGYTGSTDRFPVIYFLHGLPAGPTTYLGNAFVGRTVATGRRRAIVVAPQGARTPNEDHEYLDWSAKENWPVAIAHDLTRCIDARFRTIAKRAGRALIGLSAGAFGAFNIGLRNLATFGAVEAWSGYFAATDPSGIQDLDLGSKHANRRARVPQGPRLKARLARRPTFIGFYVGRQDSRFYTDNIVYDAALSSERIKHLFRVYAGGHSESLWQSKASMWLGLALKALD